MSNTRGEIDLVIDFVKDKKFMEAKEHCESAKNEYKYIHGRINLRDRKKIEHTDIFIDNVLNDKQQGVAGEINNALNAIHTFYAEEDRKINVKHNKAVTNETGAESQEANQGYHDDKVPVVIAKRGVVAVATEFRHIYDTVWVDAHEELGDNIEEKEKVQILLEIVQKAYQFNKEDADQQYKQAEEEVKRIVAGNGKTQHTPVASDGDKDLLVRYIYENAHIALPRLLRSFYEDKMVKFERKWKEHLRKRHIDFQLKDGIKRYTDKCLEVTWLLCIEDPPIHMAYGKHGEVFNKNWYEPFTREGQTIDYIAWPALLNKDMNEEVLLKGKAQGK